MRHWDIKVHLVGKFQLVEITNHPKIPWDTLYNLSLSLINQLTQEYQNMIVCQLIDLNQGMEAKAFQLDRLEKEYKLETVIGEGFCRINGPGQNSHENTVFAAGKPNMGWLEKILGFGGSSLPHIVYGVDRLESNWLETAEDWNRSFTKWYWMESDEAEIIRLREKVEGLAWTSDFHLNVLLEENEVEGFLQKMQIEAEKNDFIPRIGPGG